MPYVLNFIKRGSPHVFSFIWIFNAPNIQNEDVCLAFIEKNSQLSDHINNPDLFDLGKTYHVHARSKTSWKCNKSECRFSYGRDFIENTIIAKALDSEFGNDEKEEVLIWRNKFLN